MTQRADFKDSYITVDDLIERLNTFNPEIPLDPPFTEEENKELKDLIEYAQDAERERKVRMGVEAIENVTPVITVQQLKRVYEAAQEQWNQMKIEPARFDAICEYFSK